MFRVTRWALLALLALIISVVPFGISWAEPGGGNGRKDPPAHGREKEGEDRKAEERQAQEDTAEEAQANEGAEGADTEEDPDEGTPSSGTRDRYRSRQPSPGSQQEPSQATAAEAQADVLDVSFSASPASIAVGETSTLQAAVSNPGPDTVGAVEVLVQLPAHLEVVSTDPQRPNSAVLELPLGELPPGATATATVVVLALDRPGTVHPVRFAVTADDQTFHHELLVSVDQEDAEGLGLVQSSPLLIQVGDASSFSATVANNSQTALEDVAVTTEIAPELDVVGVEPIAEADAIQLGASPAGEDIVWIFESLAPGEEVLMTWTARAVTPGDLEAGNEVQATVGGQAAAASRQDTYLGFVKGVRTDRAVAPAPVVRERVVTKLVPVSTEVAGSVGGGILPVTGWSPGFLGFGGALLIGLGVVLVWASRSLRRRRLALVLAGTLLLTATACVSDQGSEEAAGPSPVSSPSSEETSDGEEEEEDDQVLGLRIDKPKSDGGTQVPPSAPGGETADTDGIAEPVAEVVYEEVSEVVSVVVPVAELPIEALGPRAGDNTMSFSWNPDSGDLQAASSRMISAGATEEVLVGLSSAGDGLTAAVTVANLAQERRLHVEGRLVLDIVSADGRSSSLVSEPIDVILDPGATTVADLAFSLPAGTYSAKGAFVTD